MIEKDISKSIQIYKEQLAHGEIQRAYIVLTKYIAELKAKFPSEYKMGNVSFGYLDYTYFPFFNECLRDKKLRFGIVLNHCKMQIELWLMGQNAPVQAEYWKLLKDTKWNQGVTEMPAYSVLEVCLESNIDFSVKDKMTEIIITKALETASEIESYLMNIR